MREGIVEVASASESFLVECMVLFAAEFACLEISIILTNAMQIMLAG